MSRRLPNLRSPLLLVAALVAAGGAHAQANAIVDAVTFFKSTTIDSGYVPFQPANLVLSDEFSNGNPSVSDPSTSGPTTAFNYGFPNARPGVLPVESNGKLSIFANADTTMVSPNALGTAFYGYGVRLLTNANDTAFGDNGKLLGLGKDSTWSIGAAFVPLTPGVGENYQIRLTDFGIGPSAGDGNDVLQLQVQGTSNGAQLRLNHQNFVAGTVDLLWSQDITIPVAADQIRLGFAHLNAGSNTINAYYSFFDGATALDGAAIATTGSIFSDEVLTRFEVRGAVPVLPAPEPGTFAMMLAGLASIGFVVRRRKRG